MSSGKRYKFIGSTIEVQTGFGAAKVVTGITAADQPVVSSTAHGQVLGAVVKMSGMGNLADYYDGNLYPVDNPVTNAFELAGVDASGYPAYDPDSPADAEATPAVFSRFCELTGMNQQGAAADQIDATTVCSSRKEFEQGFADSGTATLDFNFAPGTTVQTALREAESSGDQIALRVTLPNSGGTLILIGTVSQTSFSGSVSDGLWKGSAQFKLSGEIFFLPAD